MPRKIVDSSIKMVNLREIKPIDLSVGRRASGQNCPACGGELTRGPVPCPDGKPGCVVNHQGLRCGNCGKYWH